MAEVNPCWTLENAGATHHANVNRDLMALLNAGAEGVLASSGLGTMAVSQRGAGANMSVDVAAGIVTVFGDENNIQGLYACVNDATKNVVIAASDPTNPRVDLIVARVRDGVYSGATNAWDLFVVQGTAAPSPVDPAMPNNAACLARVAVAAAAASIVNANITDLRPFAPVGIIPVNSARRPGVLYGPYSQEPSFKSLPFDGLFIYEQDTDALLYFDGATWKRSGHHIPHATAANIFVSAARTSTSTTYVNIANGTADEIKIVNFVKHRADTKLICELAVNYVYTTVQDSKMTFGVNVNATDYDVAQSASIGGSGKNPTGYREITGLAAGTYTVTGRWKTGTGTLNLTADSSLALLVTETL